MIDIASGCGVVLYGFGLAAPGSADNCGSQRVGLHAGKRECHYIVGAGLHHLPPVGFGCPCLGGYAPPHVVGYCVPLSRKYFADCRAAHPVKAVGGFVLAPLLPAVGAELVGNLLFLFCCHVLLRLKKLNNRLLSHFPPRRPGVLQVSPRFPPLRLRCRRRQVFCGCGCLCAARGCPSA